MKASKKTRRGPRKVGKGKSVTFPGMFDADLERGALTRQAKRRGFQDAMAFARHVVSHREQFRTKTIRRAQWAINAQKATELRHKR
jgi:hypothetical protein